MSVVVLKGTLTDEGKPCQGFRLPSGELHWIVGNLSGAPLGEPLFVIGTIAETSICGDEPTIVVTWIGKKLPTATDPNQTVVRDIEVTATYSSRDPSPTFKLEGHGQALTYDNDKGLWRGRYPAFAVTGVLEILYVSEATNHQKFEVTVTSTAPANPSQPKTKTFTAFATKGSVVVQGEMEV